MFDERVGNYIELLVMSYNLIIGKTTTNERVRKDTFNML